MVSGGLVVFFSRYLFLLMTLRRMCRVGPSFQTGSGRSLLFGSGALAVSVHERLLAEHSSEFGEPVEIVCACGRSLAEVEGV